MKRPSSSSSNSSGAKFSNTVFCNHNLAAVLKTANKGANAEKKFYGCPLWPKTCGFFHWEDEMHLEIEDERKICEAKLKKLKKKKEKLKSEVMKLKVEVDKHSKWEKIVMFGLIASWIIFAFSWMFR